MPCCARQMDWLLSFCGIILLLVMWEGYHDAKGYQNDVGLVVYPLVSKYKSINETLQYLPISELQTIRWNQSSRRFTFQFPVSKPNCFWHYGGQDNQTLGLENDAVVPRSSMTKRVIPINYILTQDNQLLLSATGRSCEERHTPNWSSSVSEEIHHSYLSHGKPVAAAGQVMFGDNHTLYWGVYIFLLARFSHSIYILCPWLSFRCSLCCT